MSCLDIRVPTPGYGCVVTQALYGDVEGKKRDNLELHKVTFQVCEAPSRKCSPSTTSKTEKNNFLI